MYIAEDNISFLKLTFPSEFLERYKDGAIIKRSWTVRFTETTAIFFGARTFSIDNLTNARLEAIKRIVLGVRLEELVEYIPETEVADLIGYLNREDLIRPAYKNEFVGTAWEKQVEFFADFVDDPNAAQRDY
jgi:hypothetical protein